MKPGISTREAGSGGESFWPASARWTKRLQEMVLFFLEKIDTAGVPLPAKTLGLPRLHRSVCKPFGKAILDAVIERNCFRDPWQPHDPIRLQTRDH
jgi:hypothetical protein